MTPHLPQRLPIEAYGNGGFRFGGMSHIGSLLVLPSGMRRWDVAKPEDLVPQDFAPIFAEAEGIEILLLGMGAEMRRPPRLVLDALEARHVPVDYMSTGAAIRTYGILLAEKRQVAAALLAVANAI